MRPGEIVASANVAGVCLQSEAGLQRPQDPSGRVETRCSISVLDVSGVRDLEVGQERRAVCRPGEV